MRHIRIRHIKIRWVILGFLCFLVILSKPTVAFKKCFSFTPPEEAQIVSSYTHRPVSQGRPGYAFEVVFPEEEYEQMMTKLEQYASAMGLTLVERSPQSEVFFEDAKAEYIMVDWKEPSPKEILWHGETGYDVGYDFTKKIHLLHLLFAKNEDGTIRMYSFTT